VYFDASPGKTITLTVPVVTNTQTLLELYDGHGAAMNVTGTTQLVWTPATSGRYYVSVSPLSGDFGCAEAVGYDLLMERPPGPNPSSGDTYLPIILKNRQ
jgi:hypothetical protein